MNFEITNIENTDLKELAVTRIFFSISEKFKITYSF
jgi:hypothetical protein